MSEPRVVRAALAIIAGCTAATALYGIMRVTQFMLTTEPNPALVIWSEHAGFFWRSWIVAYAGGMVGFMVWLATARDPQRVARYLVAAVPIAALILAAQSLFVP